MSHDFTENYWEEHYKRIGERTGHLQTSPYLVSEVSDLTPGIALDAGCGEGADAIWLAGRGWHVTGVDVSSTALDKARNNAETFGVSVDFEHTDLTVWTPEEGHFDLVTSQYVHTTDNQQFIKKLANAVKPGGTLLIVGHQAPKAHEASPHAHGSHLTAEEIAAHLSPDEWEIAVAELRTSERIYPNGRTVVLNNSVLKARKSLG